MRLAILTLVLLLAPPAAGQDYEAAPAVALHRDGDGSTARASMDVRAAPEAVWDLISDCRHARRLMEELLSCRVLEQGEGWQVREHRVRGWLFRPVLRNVARVELHPYSRLSFRRVAGDWTRSDGEWVLTPIDDGRGTHVEYRVAAELNTLFPASITGSELRKRVRATLNALRREAERVG